MRIVFVVYHPVDPNITFSIASDVIQNGGDCMYLIVEKEGIIEEIVKQKGYKYKVVGSSSETVLGKFLTAVTIIPKMRRNIDKFNPDIVFSPAAPYTSFSMLLSRIPLVCWEDTETATFNYRFSMWRIDCLLLIDSYYREIKENKVLRFDGYKELAYLHPSIFKLDPSVLSELGLSKDDTIVLMRFSALHAMHDLGLRSEAVSNDNLILRFIQRIEDEYDAKVFISVTERDLDERFEKYKLKLHPNKYVHLLSYCSLYLGEGTTTASEAGVLGVPWIVVRNKPLGYLNDQENKYKLGYRLDNLEEAFAKSEIILKNKENKLLYEERQKRMISDKINVPRYLSWFILNYPNSYKTLQIDSKKQYEFES